MSSASGMGEVRPSTHAGAASGNALGAAEASWLLAAPLALVLLAAIVLLGPLLGRTFFPPSSIAFWPTVTPTLAVRPEPIEHARYLLALGAPFAMAAVVVLLARRAAVRRPGAATALVLVSQALLVAFVAAMVVAQRLITYDASYSGAPFETTYFTVPTLAVAALLTAVLVAALHGDAIAARVAEWTRETGRRHVAALAVAGLVTAIWLLTAINVEDTVRNANLGVYGNMTYWLDETFAVLNGRPPLVTFHAQYSQLWPYLTAGLMSLLGTSVGVYTVLMASGSGLALLAVFATFRRIVRSSLLALALYLPFLATGFFMEIGPLSNRYGPANLFSMFPMRYGGPYVLAWLTVRHVDRARPLHAPVLFLAAGLVAINNPEFGLPALAATLAAVLCTQSRPSWASAARLLGDAALGMLGAIAIVATLTLAVAGSLPHFGMLFTFSRLWGIGGVTMLPMPALGLHLVLYVTFAAAVVVATVRAVAREADTSLTAMLAWAGVFGLGAGSYFAGRSHPEVLVDLFSAWALALTLLLVVVVQAVRARPGRRPTVAELAVLFGFGVAVCSLAQTPAPWSQVQRLGRPNRTPPFGTVAAERLVAAATRRGERVMLLTPLGHRVAYDLDVVDVSPWATILSMPAEEQLQDAIDVLRHEGGHAIFVRADQIEPRQLRAIERAGYQRVRTRDEITELRESG